MAELLQLLSERRYAIIEAVQIGCLVGALAILGLIIADRGAQNWHETIIAQQEP